MTTRQLEHTFNGQGSCITEGQYQEDIGRQGSGLFDLCLKRRDRSKNTFFSANFELPRWGGMPNQPGGDLLHTIALSSRLKSYGERNAAQGQRSKRRLSKQPKEKAFQWYL